MPTHSGAPGARNIPGNGFPAILVPHDNSGFTII